MELLGIDRLNASGTLGLQGARTMKLRYKVRVGAGEGLNTIQSSELLPTPGVTRYSYRDESNSGAVAGAWTIRQVSPTIYHVTVPFTTITIDPGKIEENPLNRPPDITWSSATYTRVVEVDNNGKPVANSAGQPYEGQTVDESRLVLTYTRNEAFFDHVLAQQYADAVNSDVFYGAPPGFAKMACPSASQEWENGVTYWRITYEVHFHPLGWNVRLLDKGEYYYKRGDDGEFELDDAGDKKKVYPQDDNDVSATAEIALDGEGGKLPDARREDEDFEYNDFVFYAALPFSTLALW